MNNIRQEVNNISINEATDVGRSHDAMNEMQRAVKRMLDVVFSALGLIILSPVFLIIYVMLKRQRNGAVIFSQERIGYRGEPFTIYKFRTLSTVETEPQLTVKCDEENSTKTERFLREHHLDELPQLWNVLIGDMAFVGPRPERQYFINQIMERDPRYECLYQIRPGVTSYATLYNGYTDTMEKMLRRLDLDLYYLEHRSWLLDMKILAYTFLSIVGGKKF